MSIAILAAVLAVVTISVLGILFGLLFGALVYFIAFWLLSRIAGFPAQTAAAILGIIVFLACAFSGSGSLTT